MKSLRCNYSYTQWRHRRFVKPPFSLDEWLHPTETLRSRLAKICRFDVDEDMVMVSERFHTLILRSYLDSYAIWNIVCFFIEKLLAF